MIKKTAKFYVLDPSDQQNNLHNDDLNLFNVFVATSNVKMSYERAKDASLSERIGMNRESKANLTYGEITYTSMKEIIDYIRSYERSVHNCNNEDADGNDKNSAIYFKKFYDLGSGGGRATIMAASLDAVENCSGVEIMSSLHNIALEAALIWRMLSFRYQMAKSKVNFHLGSLTDLNVCNWIDGDIVYVNCTCFSKTLFLEMVNLLSNMKQGSYFISLSDPVPTHCGFVLIKEVRLDMSWYEL